MNNNQCLHPTSNRNSKLLIGTFFIIVGILLLLNNFGLLPEFAKSVIFSWQTLLIVLGLLNITSHKNSTFGIILILTGLFFLIPLFFNVPINFTEIFWPSILIILGIIIILKRYGTMVSSNSNSTAFHQQTPNNKLFYNQSDYIDDANIFGGNKQNFTSQNFKGGKITCIFGGSEIDLTNAQLEKGQHTLEIICIFGGTSIIMPANWKVRIKVSSILGGFADKRPHMPIVETSEGELIIKGIVVFGGGEIKSLR